MRKIRIKNQKSGIKGLVLIIGFLLLSLPIILNFYPSPPALAQSSACLGATPFRADGLVDTPNLSGKFNTSSGTCVIDPKASFANFKIPSFDDLKVQFYTQAQNSSTITKHTEVASPQNLPGGKIDLGGNKDHLYSFSDNVTITSNSNFTGNNNGVIFVSKDLTIGPLDNNQLTIVSDTTGLVFVVGGNVNIDSSVTRIDAVIISSGTIYTAGNGCHTSQTAVGNTLIINGSLISLNPIAPIQFCRKLPTNNSPAEIINWQAKYLAILNNLFAAPFQKWSEIASP